jgi:hypothetical protein
MKFREISIALMCVMLWLPAAGMAGDAANQSTATQGTQTQRSSMASTEKTAKEPNQGDVQSRGLFQKKKKKKVGGSAGHSPPAEQADSPGR